MIESNPTLKVLLVRNKERHVWVGYVGGIMCVKCGRIHTGVIEKLIRWWLKKE